MVKAAKTAQRFKKRTNDEDTSKLVMLTGNHRIDSNRTGRTSCGMRINTPGGTSRGWRYGVAEDVTCGDCLAPVTS